MASLDENLAKAAHYLARWRESGVRNHIAGMVHPAASGATFKNRTPVDNSPLCRVARSDGHDVDLAARAARDAFAGWAAMAGKERRALLHAIADAIEARAEEIALIEAMDTGQSLRFMAKAVTGRLTSTWKPRTLPLRPCPPRRRNWEAERWANWYMPPRPRMFRPC